MSGHQDAINALPLIVDLDGTLTPKDTLVESVITLIKRNPLSGLWLPIWLLRGRAGFKEAIAKRVRLAVHNLPYHAQFLNYLSEEKSKGRRIILATAAHHSIAEDVANYLGLFDAVIATYNRQNLKGHAKLAAIQQKVGNAFVYAGDSTADIPIWKAANSAVLVGCSKRLSATLWRDQNIRIECEFKIDGVLGDT